MEKYDVAVIGGGLLGCFAARELMRYDLTTVLIEKREDVCTGISRANSAIVYPGYDHKPGTVKQSLTLKANRIFDALCNELQVPFSRCGSLMVSFGEKADAVLRAKYENGAGCGVPGLRLISGGEAREMERTLADNIRSALYAPSAGTVDPWQLCCAAFENAVYNGCEVRMDTAVRSIRRQAGGYVLETDGGELFASAVVNCAGLAADRVHELLFPPKVRIFPQGSDYTVLEPTDRALRHIVQHESENGKGITAVPAVDGRILLESAERESEKELSAVSGEGLKEIRSLADTVLPGLRNAAAIRNFAAVRPIIRSVKYENGKYVPDGKSIGSFAIEHPEPGFLSFIGIKTPGLTCSRELGAMAAEKMAAYLDAKMRSDFVPERRKIIKPAELSFAERAALIANDPDYGEIVCLCGEISRGEIREAIRRGAVTVDGVKRRCGVMLGECQGSRCAYTIAELISRELNIPLESVTISGAGTSFAGGCHGQS